MKKSSKFSDILHVLLHMAESSKPATSEMLAKSMKTNPVVVRRAMAGLREKGFVQSEKGHGGGWQLSCDLQNVTLFDIYKAVGAPALIAITNRNESTDCLVEKAVNTATKQAFKDAEKLLIENFSNVTLSELHTIIHRQSHKRKRTL
jgi:Rrf2 family protein